MENLLLYKNYISLKNLKYFSRYILYLYCFSLPFDRIISLFGISSIPKIIAVLYCLSVLLNPKFHNALIKIPSVLISIIFLFLGVNILNGGLFFTTEFKPIEQSFLLNILIFWITYAHNKIDPFIIRKALYSYALSMSIFSLVIIFGFYDVNPQTLRISIGGSLPNDLGMNATYGGIIVLMFYESYRNRIKFINTVDRRIITFSLLSMAALFYVVILTGSRAAFLSFFMAMLIYILFTFKVRYLFMFLIVVTGFLISSGVILTRLEETVIEGNLGGRAVTMLIIFDLLKEHYLFGIGRAGYDQMLSQNLGASPSPHNVFIETIIYGGLPALFVLFFVCFKIFKASYLDFKRTGLICSLLLFWPLIMRLMTGQIYNSKIAFIIFAFLISLANDYLITKRIEKGQALHY